MTSLRTVIILVTALLLGGGILASPQVSPLHNAAATTDTIVLVGAVAGWNSSTTHPNPTINVAQGDVVNLVLSSGDGALHRWFVDVDKNGATPDCPGADICSSAFSSSTPMTFTFTVNFAVGTYTYYCSVHPTTMLGQFVVNPSTSVGGTTLPSNGPAMLIPYLAIAAALAVATVATFTWRARRES